MYDRRVPYKNDMVPTCVKKRTTQFFFLVCHQSHRGPTVANSHIYSLQRDLANRSKATGRDHNIPTVCIQCNEIATPLVGSYKLFSRDAKYLA